MGDLDDQLRRLAEQRAARTPATDAGAVLAGVPRSPSRIPVLVTAAAFLAVLIGLGAWFVNTDSEDGSDIAGTTTSLPSTTTVPTTTSDPPPDSLPSQALKSVTAVDYGVQLEIPEDWVPIEMDRTWGNDSGFIAVDTAPPGTLAEAADAVIADLGDFLGSAPTITETTVDGRPALLITGSAPALGSDFGDFVMGGVVVEAPRPVLIHDELWTNLAIAGDLAHLRAAIESVRWVAIGGPPPVRTKIDFPLSDTAYDLVAGTAEGIELQRTFGFGDVDVIAVGPTALAFFVDGFLVHQDASDDLIWGDGPVRVRTATGATELDLGDGRMRLLDAAIVDGRAMALVSRRTGSTPDDTREDLLLVELESDTITDLGGIGGWESGAADARVADGAIVVLMSAEGSTWISALGYTGNEIWSTAEEFDGPAAIGVIGSAVWGIDPGWNADITTPVFDSQRYHLRTGEPIETNGTGLIVDDGAALGDGYCARPILWPSTICGQSSGTPLQVDLYTQTIGPVIGALSGGHPTAVDLTVSTTFAELDPCGPGNPGPPADSLISETIVLDDGTILTATVFEQDGELYVQAFDDDWATNRLRLSLPSGMTNGLRIVAGSSPVIDQGDFGVVLVDRGTAVSLVGCELTISDAWIE